MNKAIFLDRDGVINEVKTSRVRFVNQPHQFYFLEGSLEAIKILSQAGYLIFVVTNQGGVGLGYLSIDQLQSIHDYMVDEIKSSGGNIHDISCCIHKPHEGCACRKPEPGMLLELAQKYDIDLSSSYMIGDRETDIEAGSRAGTKTILLCSDDASRHIIQADKLFKNLLEASFYIAAN
ncbi:D-glycero-alpha-D-manno-heptose-1,7-bisphosphate 7-phosphatase [Rossellomorea aquimaris]|uniref:D-glycero-alpha-D-manno-heptose-1,7-bisphosphate 7-phosphatase n=1 Tax=Rossellomorea aquimaris TaxID=189382 RepID=UPI0007D0535A|nr:HAD family hydrolase [Rossellomorea aquimaris]